jgi:hypothetical protein
MPPDLERQKLLQMYRRMSEADEATRNEQFGGMENWLGFLAKMKRENDIKDEELVPKEDPMLDSRFVSLVPPDNTSFGGFEQTEPIEQPVQRFKKLRELK